MKIRKYSQNDSLSHNKSGKTEPIRYRLDAECAKDAERVRAILLPYLTAWQMKSVPYSINGIPYLLPGVEFEFEIAPGGPDYATLLWLIDRLPNCHVASDTVALIEDYSGERSYRALRNVPAARPSHEQLGTCMDAVDLDLRVNQIEHERSAYISETFHAAHDRDMEPSSTEDNADRPGWVVALQHGATGLTRVHRIDAIDGNPNRLICGKPQTQARMLTLGA